ncbi:unnamed protein product [Agarophyton chilense]
MKVWRARVVRACLVFLAFRSSRGVAAACAADYASCGGGVPSPVGNLRCCSPNFFCYTQGPYFSQCRPRDESHLIFSTPYARWYTLHQHPSRSFLTPRQAARYGASPVSSLQKLAALHPLHAALRATLPRMTHTERSRLQAHVALWPGVCDLSLTRGVLNVTPCSPAELMAVARRLSELHVVAAIYSHA